MPSGPTSAVSGVRHADHWFASAVWAFDARLRRRQGVIEYSDRADCIFRIQVTANPVELTLADGTLVRAGERTIILHAWNEQWPQMPAGGPTVGWARRLMQHMDLSLHELGRYLTARPQLDDIKIIRADLHPTSLQEHRQFARVMARYGFETVSLPDPQTLAGRIQRLGENILILILILAGNPAAFRLDGLRSRRDAAYLSRRFLEHRYRIGDNWSSA